MHRMALTYLKDNWLASLNRKPLIIRGARQVGKTWLIRQLAAISDKTLIEVNFEKNPQVFSLFLSNDPHQILTSLSVFLNQKIEISQSLIILLDFLLADLSPLLSQLFRYFR